jgi:hypothetical protein
MKILDFWFAIFDLGKTANHMHTNGHELGGSGEKLGSFCILWL